MRVRIRDNGGELTARDVETLRLIGSMPDSSPTQVAAAIGLSPSSVSTIIKRLHTRSLISRKHGPGDNRKVLLRRLVAGDAYLERLDNRARRATAGTAASPDAR